MSRLVLCALCFAILASCEKPADVEGAKSQLIGQGIAPAVLFDISNLSNTQIVGARNTCEGIVGSVIPPLSRNQCVRNYLGEPLLQLENILRLGSPDPNRRRIYLNGIEKFWVGQNDDANCWAAALEITRKFLRLKYVSQDQLLSQTANVCPRLRYENRKAAEAYEIIYTIIMNLKQYDISRTTPHFCTDAECIISSLARRHPVIMLGRNHAVVIIGIDYTTRRTDKGPLVFVERAYILDPSLKSEGKVLELSPQEFCRGDVFLAY